MPSFSLRWAATVRQKRRPSSESDLVLTSIFSRSCIAGHAHTRSVLSRPSPSGHAPFALQLVLKARAPSPVFLCSLLWRRREAAAQSFRRRAV